MHAAPRQKACIACAESKRRCDKQLPECQRCLDRDVDCVYPQPKRRRRDPPPQYSFVGGLNGLGTLSNADALGSGLDLVDWSTVGADLEVSLSDAIVPYMATPATSIPGVSAHGLAFDGNEIPGTTCPWFLRHETWTVSHGSHEPACVTFNELEPFIHDVEEILHCWVKDGHNSFIHRRLYDKIMPASVQDAFTTLAAYHGRTPATQDTILQIANERSSALAGLSAPTAGGMQGIREHLARVQALFVYEFILLFDGSVRHRAAAERHVPTLRQWSDQMWQAVKGYRWEDTVLGDRSLNWAPTEFDRQYNAASEIWQLWILTESVRRTHLVIDTICNIYQIMTQGWAECSGTAQITARRGLWEAENGLKWSELCSAKPPLLVPSLQPAPLISQYAADEVDDFATTFWKFVVGTDKIQCWKDKVNNPIVV